MISLPESVLRKIPQQEYTADTIGKSGAGVYLFPEMVLKIQPDSAHARLEGEMLSWLAGKLPVPMVYHREVSGGNHYLLMERLTGSMACDEAYMHDPKLQSRLLAQAIEMLWAVDVAGCPGDQSLDRKLADAEYHVVHGLVDVDDAMPDTFGAGDFRDPEALLHWLRDNRPAEELTLSHGDLCLPNVFFSGSRVSGFIDFSRSGVGDKWNDIALCHRSLGCNFQGRYGRSYPGYDPLALFSILGIQPDWDRIRYYILLDELF